MLQLAVASLEQPLDTGALLTMLAGRVPLADRPVYLLLVFFLYSFAGYILECVVLTIEGRRLVVNRGFATHLPLCIIYGFGSIIGYALLIPLKNNLLLLFVVGALAASVFEFITAQVQLRLFGSFWWDYSDKPLNYRGILCLESTLAWGVAAIIVVRFVHHGMVGLAHRMPAAVATPLVTILLLAYGVDFLLSARRASRTRHLPDDALAPERKECHIHPDD